MAGMEFADAEYPADPYPGCRPEFSFVHDGGRGRRIFPVPAARPSCARVPAPSGYVVGPTLTDLDRWLGERAAPPLADRLAVLAYGSNACPSKLTWLRDRLGLSGPVVVLRARCTGVAAVWAAGYRARDGVRPATLAAAPGAVEDHAVLLATPGQLAAFDRCEGAGSRYARVVLDLAADDAVSVAVEGARAPRALHAYVGARADRMPALLDGAPVRVASSAPDVLAAETVPAARHGLEHLITVAHTPHGPAGGLARSLRPAGQRPA